MTFPVASGHRLGVEDVHIQERRNGIQWTYWIHLYDPDFSHDLILLSNTQQQMHEKIGTVADNSSNLVQRVHRGKSKAIKNNAAVSPMLITLEGDGLEDVTSFAYLGSIVDKESGLMPM